MDSGNQFDDRESKEFSLFEWIVAAFEWCKIVLASLIVGLIGWLIIYEFDPNVSTNAMRIGVIVVSLLVGIYLATKNGKEARNNSSS